MTLQALALAALVARCAPGVAPSTMAAIVQVESGRNPLAIGDNTTRRSYYPPNRAVAEALARRLLKSGHSVDLGLAQINSVHLMGFGVNVHTIFDSCTNLNLGARILSDDYRFAVRRYGRGQMALRHAIGMYNTGQLNAGESYIRRVLAAAGVQEKHQRDLIISASDTRQSSLLVRVRSVAVTPSYAPILITIERRPATTAF